MWKKIKKLLFSRVFIIGFFIAVQMILLLLAVFEFSRYFIWYYVISLLLEIVYLLKIANSKQNMAYKLAWSILICVFPAFGVAIHMILCGNGVSERLKKKMRFMSEITARELEHEGDDIKELAEVDRDAAKQASYIKNAANYPTYKSVKTLYYKTGEEAYQPMLDALEKAEKYIFLEYFIIKEGGMWDSFHEIMLRKAREGVDVRLIYDDIGSIALRRDFAEELEKEGIKCRVFHRFIPVLSAHQNNRDHRKIFVIDGKYAFTGGLNIADEYINQIERFGYWKDNVIYTEGEAAWSFTVMFLTMWDYLCDTPNDKCGDYSGFKPDFGAFKPLGGAGYVQPYCDDPLDYEPVGENVYLGILEAAYDYVWITTPYLIIDEQMEQSLIRAAKSGVDVRIITPGIPDKKIVYETTKSFYPNLIKNGVKIYEYTPGFIHAKTFLCDDKYASVGSVNLDYRSLYLHFECGMWTCGTDCVKDIKNDFHELFECSCEIKDTKTGFFRSVFRAVLELFAPLM